MHCVSPTHVPTSNFEVGNRVMFDPSTDQWMRGIRYGKVINVDDMFVHVKADVNGAIYQAKASLLSLAIS